MPSHFASPDVLHVVQHEKFVPALIDLFSKNLQPSRHHFFFTHGGVGSAVTQGASVTRESDFQNRLMLYASLAKALNGARKIVLHGLFSSEFIIVLWLQPWLWRRCYWVIWGGDLYTYVDRRGGWRWWLKEFFRRPVLRNIGNLVTYIPGDVELARQWYGCKGKYRECLMYPSNTFADQPTENRAHSSLVIQIGNSADPGNCHHDMLEALVNLNIRCSNAVVIAPLSYGDADYADLVTRRGLEALGDKFRAMRDFLSTDAYRSYLDGVDIAIFAQRRQQAMGNMIALLGLGKKVVLRRDTTPWMLFKSLGFAVYPFDAFDLRPLETELAEKNRQLARQHFSGMKLVQQWRGILESP